MNRENVAVFDLAERFREVILDGTWVSNTNYKTELCTVDWVTASKKVEGFNTILQLAQHIHYYIHGIAEAFETGEIKIKDQYSFEFKAIQSQEEWDVFLLRFWNDTERLALIIEELPLNPQKSVFIDQKYGSISRNINGMIGHSYYHLGQIVQLKKMLHQGL